MRRECKVCTHMEADVINRFLKLPEGTKGKRGPRSLARPFGLDRREIARHERQCLFGGRTLRDDPQAAHGGDNAA